MSRKVVVEFVQYYSVSVSIPDSYSDKIEEWTDEQKEIIAELANAKQDNRGTPGDWEINENCENNGFVEIVNEN